MIYDILALLAALVILGKSSTSLINSVTRLSRLSGISELVIGFMIIAVSTSIPEMAIAVISSSNGQGAISLGNLIGSNIANLTLLFGVMALYGAKFKLKGIIEIDKAILITTMIALFLMVIGKSELIFGIFCICLFYVFSSVVYGHGIASEKIPGIKTIETIKSALIVVATGVIIAISAHFVVAYSIAVASDVGLTSTVIAATLVAAGTTLPELAVNIAAVKQKRYSIAIGDSIGSIVTNLTLVLGVASMISPIVIDRQLFTLLGALIFVNLSFLFIAYRQKFGIGEGKILLAIYAAYVVMAVLI